MGVSDTKEQATNPVLEVLMPVYNEGASVETTIREIYNELSPRVSMRFIVCEDGSTDDTKEVLSRLSHLLPMKMITSNSRKNYSRALTDGMKIAQAPWLLCIDSDGQFDPKDFWQFWQTRENYDIITGCRTNRAQSRLHVILSRSFYFVYKLFFRVPIHDPNSCFFLARTNIIKMLIPQLGKMPQGFGWEFIARAHMNRYSLKELPVKHRRRLHGKTKIYGLNNLLAIGFTHIIALFKIRFLKEA